MSSRREPASSGHLKTAGGEPLASAPASLRPVGLFLPAVRRFVVGGARLDPGRAAGAVLLLPERRLRLEVVHDELAGGEGIAAMRARHRDEHDRVVRLELAVAMNHGAVHHLPARGGLVDDLADRVLRHAGVMLERHAHLAHQTHEARHRADLAVFRHRAHLCAEVEVLALNSDLHPPVTGGKNAISPPAFRVAAGCAMSWFTAARTARLGANTFAHSPPRARR